MNHLRFAVVLIGVMLMSILDPNEDTFVFPADFPPANIDESKVPSFAIPDPLRTSNGSDVITVQQWNGVKRPEILELFQNHVYGQIPLRAIQHSGLALKSEVTDMDPTAFGGKATRIQLELSFLYELGPQQLGDSKGPMVNVLIYVPNGITQRVPAFIGYNFGGNHTISDDPGVELPLVWTRKDNEYFRTMADESTRGSAKSRWPIEKLIDSGYAVITAYYCDVVPDFPDGRKDGVQGIFDRNDIKESVGNDWGAIATWAWGLSMIANVCALEPDLDPIRWDQIIVFGHSRLGKTALWAGAMDSRFAMIISNNSGCGGAAISRREFGETMQRMNTVFPHWLCGNSKEYNSDITDCPVDQHELLALIAPRPLYVASAVEDTWADPKGEFLSCLYADPVYRLWGTDGLGDTKKMPPVDHPVGKTIRYHVRSGAHDITEYDWDQYIRFANDCFKQ